MLIRSAVSGVFSNVHMWHVRITRLLDIDKYNGTTNAVVLYDGLLGKSFGYKTLLTSFWRVNPSATRNDLEHHTGNSEKT